MQRKVFTSAFPVKGASPPNLSFLHSLLFGAEEKRTKEKPKNVLARRPAVWLSKDLLVRNVFIVKFHVNGLRWKRQLL